MLLEEAEGVAKQTEEQAPMEVDEQAAKVDDKPQEPLKVDEENFPSLGS